MEGQQWVDQRGRTSDRARLGGLGDGDRDQQRRFKQVWNGDGHGGDGAEPADNFFGDGELQSFDNCSRRDVTMQRDGTGDRKL